MFQGWPNGTPNPVGWVRFPRSVLEGLTGFDGKPSDTVRRGRQQGKDASANSLDGISNLAGLEFDSPQVQ